MGRWWEMRCHDIAVEKPASYCNAVHCSVAPAQFIQAPPRCCDVCTHSIYNVGVVLVDVSLLSGMYAGTWFEARGENLAS